MYHALNNLEERERERERASERMVERGREREIEKELIGLVAYRDAPHTYKHTFRICIKKNCLNHPKLSSSES